jgi:hypothetical protein
MPEALSLPPKPASLYEAILAVQSEVGTLPKDATNPHFKSKYLSLDTLVERITPYLAKNGLIWQTFPTAVDGQPALKYMLTHVPSEQREGDTMLLPLSKNDMQGLGSALTYARRYSLCAVLNLVADDDDDGNAAARPASGSQARFAATQRASMTDEAKALLKTADDLYTDVDHEKVPKVRYEAFKDSTGYTVDGLQRLVDWLRDGAPKA